MTIETDKYIRKPLFVNATRITEENFDSATVWCEGLVETETTGPREGQKFIKVSVHGIPKTQRQTKAFVGDWLLHTERGFKVYTDNAFRSSFNQVEGAEPGVVELAVPEGVSAELVREPVVIEEADIHSISAVAENPDPANGVGEIVSVTPAVSDSDSAPPPQAPNGQRILTEAEVREMTNDEVKELLSSGQAVLEQDLV